MTVSAHLILRHERAHETILRARKLVHANIKFVEPWRLRRIISKCLFEQTILEYGGPSLPA